MDLIKTLSQALLQGLTEFLPVSSSGHLVIFQSLFNVDQPDLLIDLVLHAGTFLAVVVYFGRDLVTLGISFMRHPLSGRNKDTRYVGRILLAGIPAVIMGLVIRKWFAGIFENLPVVLIFLGLTAFMLILSDRIRERKQDACSISLGAVLLIGVFQGLAIHLLSLISNYCYCPDR